MRDGPGDFPLGPVLKEFNALGDHTCAHQNTKVGMASDARVGTWCTPKVGTTKSSSVRHNHHQLVSLIHLEINLRP